MARKKETWRPRYDLNGRLAAGLGLSARPPADCYGQPLRWSQPREVRVAVDVFAPDAPEDLRWLVWAVMASAGRHRFLLATAHPAEYRRFVRGIERRSPGSARAYERRMRAHFRRYKRQFVEGYSLPGPPTPQLRYLYDRAAAIERRPRRPDGTTIYAGFSGGEFHWRAWPLDNVTVEVA